MPLLVPEGAWPLRRRDGTIGRLWVFEYAALPPTRLRERGEPAQTGFKYRRLA